ncbi:MAG: hypothetical protein NTZ73_01290 [Candidatus Diapherotrites archaeon]|nr:hypothetical protein [Candidatus Diapherotrites archaeon]
MRELFFEEKAQAGAVFRLMVDSIIMFVVLVIIVAAIYQFQQMRTSISTKEFNELVLSAINTPSGEVIESSRALFFPSGKGYTSTALSALTGKDPASFNFESNLAGAKISDDKSSITFEQPVEAEVYALCKPYHPDVPCQTGCGQDMVSVDGSDICQPQGCVEICCRISFGKALKKETDTVDGYCG